MLTKKAMPLCAPWDFESVKILDDYGMEGLKLLLQTLQITIFFELSKTQTLICSTGMTSEQEVWISRL